MKFKTKLVITFLAIIILPLILMVLAFFYIGMTIVHNSDLSYGIDNTKYSTISDSLSSFSGTTDELYETIVKTAEENAMQLEDREFLSQVNANAYKLSSYLLVRKNNEIFYSGNEMAAERIFDRLPAYGSQSQDPNSGYYINDMQKLVKQVDFVFSDGEKGSVFLITRVSSVISKDLLINLFFSVLIILVVTGILLTQWIYRAVFAPVTELNVAMKHIADGNFEYRLSSEDANEIGELYRNYEDMRLRLKESSDEKIQNENQNRELISNITHDLKTPITAIKGYAEGIIEGVADTPEKVDRYIKIIYTKANDMNRLINELTYYSGINSSRIPYNFLRMNLDEFFQDCIEDVGMDLESQNIKLSYANMTDKDTRIIADPEQLKKVIDNIIGNSVKYLDKPEGNISIRILDRNDSVQIEIEDNGKGIAAKDLGKIFERFYRTDASRNSAMGGSGIGLSIVKKIIEDHGGYIWASSKEGVGTCMHFVIRKYKEVEV